MSSVMCIHCKKGQLKWKNEIVNNLCTDILICDNCQKEYKGYDDFVEQFISLDKKRKGTYR